MQITELTAQLRVLKSGEEARIREVEALRREVEILRNSVKPGTSGTMAPGLGGVLDQPGPLPLPQRPLGNRMKSKSADQDVGERRGESSEISKLPSIDISAVSDVDEASIDEVIFNLIQLRNIRRPNLPPLVNPLRPNLTAIPPPDPTIPSKRGRGRPRIIRNEQVAPPRIAFRAPASATDSGGVSTPLTATTIRPDEWTSVVKRRRAKRKKGGRDVSRPDHEPHLAVPALTPAPSLRAPTQTRRRPPRTAAVTITGVGETFSYAAALKKARENIPLVELGIDKSRIRRTINGGRIIEIPGLDAANKADKLADKLRLVLGQEAVVARPSVKGEVRIVGLDDTVSTAEVASTISEIGGCAVTDVKVRTIRLLSNRLGAVWAQCPLAAANKVSSLKKMRVGWTIARVELLAARPLQCYKCWRFGHTRFNCGSQANFFGLCFRCGTGGHAARDCTASPRCVVCENKGLDSAHRFGTATCSHKPGPGVAGLRTGSEDGGSSD